MDHDRAFLTRRLLLKGILRDGDDNDLTTVLTMPDWYDLRDQVKQLKDIFNEICERRGVHGIRDIIDQLEEEYGL